MKALLVILALTLTACASPLQAFVNVANVTGAAGDAAAPILRERCTDPMVAAASSKDVEAAKKIAAECDGPVTAYESLRVLHVALRGAIVTYASGGDSSEVLKLLLEVGDAAAKLTNVIKKTWGVP